MPIEALRTRLTTGVAGLRGWGDRNGRARVAREARALAHRDAPAQALRGDLPGHQPDAGAPSVCRGYRTNRQINAFFTAGPVSQPLALPDMDRAVARYRAAQSGERVAIYGDFDCDGITAAAILAETLTGLGLHPAVHIPTRADGHGLQPEGLAALADAGVTLVISADCGIGALERTRVARGMGMDVIITDHHEPRAGGALPGLSGGAGPPAPISLFYPWRSLCGAGVVYKLAQALSERVPGALDPHGLLDLVALGTVADVVPLRDVNRSLVIHGLRKLRETRGPAFWLCSPRREWRGAASIPSAWGSTWLPV